ncbi:MAG: acetolactate synthase [Legionella sp.]|nr:MAG: acetolactate synthase [Legionella sp.]
MMNVAQYIAQFLLEKGVHHVFGYQGGATLKLVHEMMETGKIEFIQNYHEQASAFCADAYSRVTGNIGVALATSGPGATNFITGIANANLDSIPTLFITGQDYKTNIMNPNGARQNGFQDLDIVSVVKPITKYAVLVTDAHQIKYELEKAYWYATSNRPGAVLIDIPIDIQFANIDPNNLPGYESNSIFSNCTPDLNTNIVIELIQAAKRPIILVGGGVRLSKAQQEVRQFSEYTNIPVVSTLNGLDLVESNYGFAGLYGNTAANLAVQNSDLLLVFGARLGQRQVGKFPEKYTKATIVHVDIDSTELKRVFPNELAVKADIRAFLREINAQIEGIIPLQKFSHWHKTIRDWKEKYHINAYLNQNGLDPVRVAEEIMHYICADAILVNDVGQNQMWVSQAFQVRSNQRLLNSVGHGSMGYSLPAAIGSKIAFPDKQVISFTGDGGLQMNIQELMLVGHRQLGIKCIVFNNNTLGMIREVQARYYDAKYYGSNPKDFGCVDLRKLAIAYNLGFFSIKNLEDITCIQPLLVDDRPYIIEVCLDLDSKLTNRYDESDCFEKERIND